jgi:hypothetical protein
MKMSISAKTSIMAAVLGAAATAWASVDTSPKPGGVYRLKPGIYVARDSPCETAPNAAIRTYDGKGIGTAHTHACKAVVRSRQGSTYVVDQTCIDAGTGPGKRFTERQRIRVQDALTFTQSFPQSFPQSRGAGTTYRYCPSYQLPAGVR